MNASTIIFLLILLVCVIRGMKTGLLRMLYGFIAWIFVIMFISYSSPFINEYLLEETQLQQVLSNQIEKHLENKYDSSEDSPEEISNLQILIPDNFKEKIDQSIETTKTELLATISEYISKTIINTLSKIFSVVLAFLLVWLVGKIVFAIGVIPFLKGPNKFLGLILGFIEAIFIIWLIMFIADIFPESALGRYLLQDIYQDEILLYLYNNNYISIFLK